MRQRAVGGRQRAVGGEALLEDSISEEMAASSLTSASVEPTGTQRKSGFRGREEMEMSAEKN
jgi:hypothetical protein